MTDTCRCLYIHSGNGISGKWRSNSFFSSISKKILFKGISTGDCVHGSLTPDATWHPGTSSELTCKFHGHPWTSWAFSWSCGAAACVSATIFGDVTHGWANAIGRVHPSLSIALIGCLSEWTAIQSSAVLICTEFHFHFARSYGGSCCWIAREGEKTSDR